MNHLEFSTLPDDALIRLSALIAMGLVPFSASTLWRKCQCGQFPKPLKISDGVTAWRVRELREWLADPTSYLSAKDKETKQIGRRKVAA